MDTNVKTIQETNWERAKGNSIGGIEGREEEKRWCNYIVISKINNIPIIIIVKGKVHLEKAAGPPWPHPLISGACLLAGTQMLSLDSSAETSSSL